MNKTTKQTRTTTMPQEEHNATTTRTTATRSFDCIVIGGGLGGLVAGATLGKNGKKVLLLEQHYIPGGCATAFKRKDYILEVGLHETDGLSDPTDIKNEIFHNLGIDKEVKFLPVAEFFRYKSDTGIDCIHPHGTDEFLRTLIQRFPHEEKGIRKYLEMLEKTPVESMEYPTSKWKQLLAVPMMPFRYPNLLRAVTTSLGAFLDEIIQDEELKLILTGNLNYYHDDPYSMSLITFSHAQGSFIRGGGHFIQGGSQKLSNALAKVIVDTGGQVLLGKKVTRILLDNDRACGVTFVDAFNTSLEPQSIKAERIIFNGAIPVLPYLLPEEQAQLLQKKFDHLTPAMSLTCLYIGFDKPPSELGNRYYSTMLAGDIHSLKELKNNFQSDWSKRSITFVDYSQIDAKLAPEGKAVGAICTASTLAEWEFDNEQAYKEQKEKVTKVLIERLEQYIPGISQHIECYELGTSKTIQSYIHTPNGSVYGYRYVVNSCCTSNIVEELI